jgi:hypothetical protein
MQPHWHDHCEHPKESYVGSFQLKQQDSGSYDVYVFKVKHSMCGYDVCIRYGSRPSEYISPGALSDLLSWASDPRSSLSYRMAASLIKVARPSLC